MEATATFEQQNSTSPLVPKHEGLTFLEQLTVSVLEGTCSTVGVPFLMRSDYQKREMKFARGRCGMWSCPECAMWNAKKWIARTIDGINKLPAKEWYFATVTAKGNWRGHASLKNLRANWHKLRKRMARMAKKQGEKLFYMRVWEHHKDGSYHMHIITNVKLSTRWLKDNAHKCGMGYQAKIDKAVNAGQAAGYMAKYMLKQSENLQLYKFPKGARRIECSRNWVAWHEKEDKGWEYAGDVHSANGAAIMRKASGWKVESLAIKNELNRRKQNDRRRNQVNGNTNGHASTSNVVDEFVRRETGIEGEDTRQPLQRATQPLFEVSHPNISSRTNQSANATEGILKSVQDKTREST